MYCLPFSKEYLTNTKITSISFLLALFFKGKSLFTVYLFQKDTTQIQQKSNTQTLNHFNFFPSCSLFQRQISVYCLPFSKGYHTNTTKEQHTNTKITSISFLLALFFKGKSLFTVYLFQKDTAQTQQKSNTQTQKFN